MLDEPEFDAVVKRADSNELAIEIGHIWSLSDSVQLPGQRPRMLNEKASIVAIAGIAANYLLEVK